MKYFKIHYITVIALIFLIVSCDRNQTSEPIELKTYTKDYYSNSSTQNAKIISIYNSMGGVIITGWSFVDSMRVYMYKTIEATSKELAEMHFDDIQSIITKTGDTLVVAIDYLLDSDEIKYKHSSLSLDIPYKMNCKVSYSNGEIFIDNLSSDLSIEESENKIQIDRHEGSCEVTSNNEISVQTVLPDSDHCKLNTTEGDVSLSIPDTTNSKVDLKTDDGTITYTNLTFDQVLIQNNNNLNGILGTGDAEITVYTKKGDIELIGFK